MDIAKTDNHATKNKNKPIKKINSNQPSQHIQSLDTSFITVTHINNSCSDTLEQEYSLPFIDLSLWKDGWQAYAEIISKVIIKNILVFIRMIKILIYKNNIMKT